MTAEFDPHSHLCLFVVKRGLDRAHRAADKVARKHPDIRVRVGMGAYASFVIEELHEFSADIVVVERSGQFEQGSLPIDSTEYQFEKCTQRLIAALKARHGKPRAATATEQLVN